MPKDFSVDLLKTELIPTMVSSLIKKLDDACRTKLDFCMFLLEKERNNEKRDSIITSARNFLIETLDEALKNLTRLTSAAFNSVNNRMFADYGINMHEDYYDIESRLDTNVLKTIANKTITDEVTQQLMEWHDNQAVKFGNLHPIITLDFQLNDEQFTTLDVINKIENENKSNLESNERNVLFVDEIYYESETNNENEHKNNNESNMLLVDFLEYESNATNTFNSNGYESHESTTLFDKPTFQSDHETDNSANATTQTSAQENIASVNFYHSTFPLFNSTNDNINSSTPENLNLSTNKIDSFKIRGRNFLLMQGKRNWFIYQIGLNEGFRYVRMEFNAELKSRGIKVVAFNCNNKKSYTPWKSKHLSRTNSFYYDEAKKYIYIHRNLINKIIAADKQIENMKTIQPT